MIFFDLTLEGQRARDSPEEMGSSHRFAVGTVIAWGLFGVRLGHRDGLEKMVMGKKFRCDQTKLVLITHGYNLPTNSHNTCVWLPEGPEPP